MLKGKHSSLLSLLLQTINENYISVTTTVRRHIDIESLYRLKEITVPGPIKVLTIS